MLIVGIVLAIALAMFAAELVAPGRRWPQVAGWWLRAAILNGVQVATVFVSTATLNRWLQGASLFDLEAILGSTGGAVIGYVIITFVFYWWHRARHEVPILWLIFHQVHHSPQRIEILTTFYKHPVEIVVNSAMSSIILYVVCGLGPAAASLAIMLTGVGELIYHWNFKTPYWLGFIFQRPESHCIHHKLGWHTQNYSDLPIWDMLFGTFRNPRAFDGRCGFANEAERRLRDMLLIIDVNPPKKAKASA